MIDWNTVWKLTLFASRQGNLENGYERDEAAERYDRPEALRQNGERRAAALEIDPSWSVMDIGAGPWTLALPLARRPKSATRITLTSIHWASGVSNNG